MGARIARKRSRTAREIAAEINKSDRTVRAIMAQPRSEYLAEQRERRERVARYYLDGHTWQETADHFGVDNSTAFRLGTRGIQENELTTELDRRPKFTRPNPMIERNRKRRAAIAQYYLDGHTWKETADHFGIDTSTACRLGKRGLAEMDEYAN